MIIHNQIRQEVVDLLLSAGIEQIRFFHNGKAVFTDLEQQLPAVSVFIDETEISPMTACDDEWEGDLQIAIYLPPFASEADLDVVAVQISQVMKNAEFDTVSECVLSRYSYDYDSNDAAWISSKLHYNINYYS